MNDSVSVFDYDDYREYLKDKFEARKQLSIAFSHRYFAKKAGFRTPNFLKLIVGGKRNLTRESIRKFAKGFELSETETRCFEAMVLSNQAKTIEDKREYYGQLLRLKEAVGGKKIERQQYEYYSKWYVPVIREMVDLPDFQPNSAWIREKLRYEISSKEASNALKLLLELGMIEKTADGSLQQTSDVVTTGPEAAAVQVAEFHKQMLPIVEQAIDRVPAEEREISSLTATISPHCFEQVKAKIRDFKQELIKLMKEDKATDSVYQVNFQAFPLVRNKKKTRRG